MLGYVIGGVFIGGCLAGGAWLDADERKRVAEAARARVAYYETLRSLRPPPSAVSTKLSLAATLIESCQSLDFSSAARAHNGAARCFNEALAIIQAVPSDNEYGSPQVELYGLREHAYGFAVRCLDELTRHYDGELLSDWAVELNRDRLAELLRLLAAIVSSTDADERWELLQQASMLEPTYYSA